MNTQGLNSGVLNGGLAAKWVVSASALAFAGVASSAEALRVLQSSAYGDAAAAVTLTGQQNVAAKALGLALVASSTEPTSIFAATASATAGSFGNGAVRRLVIASASADSTARGEALAADVLGESQAFSTASGSAQPFIVHPGRANVLCEAFGAASAVPIRMSPVQGLALSQGYGEATLQLSGEAFKRLDGFCFAASTATASVRNDYMAIIATNGAFDFGRTQGSGRPFIRYQAAASVWSNGLAEASALKTVAAAATGQGLATGFSDFTAKIPAAATGAAVSQAFATRARVAYVARATATSECSGLASAQGVRRFAASLSSAKATSNTPVWAQHQFADATNDTLASGVTAGTLRVSGKAVATAAIDGFATYANNPKGSAFAEALSTGVSDPLLSIYGHATVLAKATGAAIPASNPKGDALAVGTATGNALGFTNIDVLAPASRSMQAPAEDRVLMAPEENRTMTVEA